MPLPKPPAKRAAILSPADFESQALEQNVIDWVLARAKVEELQTTFAELTGVAA